jgi:hypothetical protein
VELIKRENEVLLADSAGIARITNHSSPASPHVPHAMFPPSASIGIGFAVVNWMIVVPKSRVGTTAITNKVRVFLSALF